MKTKLMTWVCTAVVAGMMSACQGAELEQGAPAPSTQAEALSSASLAFYPLTAPVRLLDTRAGQSAVYAPGQPLHSEVLTRYSIGGASQVPSTARVLLARVSLRNPRTTWTVYDYQWRDTYAVTDTATDNEVYPHLQAFTSATWSSTSSAYVRVGSGPLRPTEQLVAIALDDTGAFSLRPAAINVHRYGDREERWVSSYTFDATVDVVGYYAAPGAPGALYLHLFDTQQSLLYSCSGYCWPTAPMTLNGPLGSGQTRSFVARGTFQRADTTGTFTIPANAKYLVGSIKALEYAYNQFTGPSVTNIYAAGGARPETGLYIENSGWDAAQFFTGLSSTGSFSLTTDHAADITVDVAGYYSEQPGDDGNGVGLVYTAQPGALRSAWAQLEETDYAHLSAAQSGMPTNAVAVSGRVDYASGGEGSCISVLTGGFYWYSFGSDLCAMTTPGFDTTAQATFVRRMGTGQLVDVGPGAPDLTYANLELDVAGYFTPAY